MESNNILFPYIGIKLSINPIAFSLGPIKVYWYGLILAMGFLAAYMYVYNRSGDFKIDKNRITNIIIFGSICGIIGARLYYVVFYPGDFYRVNPLKIFCISEGGIAIYGGIVGGIIGGSIAAYFKKIPLLPLLDLVSLGFLIGQSIGRWGNFINQEAFGETTTLPWGMSSERTMNKIVHPCFLYESLWCFMVFLTLHFYSKFKGKDIYPGKIFLLYIFFYGLGRFFIEGLRTDSLLIFDFKVSQLVSIIIIIISLFLALFFRNKREIHTSLK